MASNAPITELDFLQIKNNLKAYLQGQTRFADYNFEGSNINVLLDVLAYNTFQNSFFTNMAINEMFLDSSQLMSSVVSHAKALNYTPHSRISARAKVNVSLSVPTSGAPNFIVIPAKTEFVAKCGNQTFKFFNDQSYTIQRVNGVYNATGLEIFEGRYVQEYFQVTNNTKYVLSNLNPDISSLKVYVKDSIESTIETEYVYLTNIFGTSATSNVFYVQAKNDSQYELVFGLNNFGVEPSNGNIVRAEYRVTNGEEANGIMSFTLAQNTIQGYAATITLNTQSDSGAERETIESIKYFAPRSLQVQDRAITENDYEIILKSKFPEIQAISVYGGEELNPPRFGKVIISVDVKDADGVSDNNKTKYAAYLSSRSPITIKPVIISSEFMFLGIDSTIYYNTKTTSASESSIRQITLDAINSYNTEYLSDFKRTFRASRLSSIIDAADAHILSNDIKVLAIIPMNPLLGVSNNFSFTFNNQLMLDHKLETGESLATHQPVIKSSLFVYNGRRCFIQDNGLGTLQIIKPAGVTFTVLNQKVGSVNYETGHVNIKNFNISSYVGSEIKLYGWTRNNTITPSKNRIISIRPEDVVINVIGVNG